MVPQNESFFAAANSASKIALVAGGLMRRSCFCCGLAYCRVLASSARSPRWRMVAGDSASTILTESLRPGPTALPHILPSCVVFSNGVVATSTSGLSALTRQRLDRRRKSDGGRILPVPHPSSDRLLVSGQMVDAETNPRDFASCGCASSLASSAGLFLPALPDSPQLP